MFQKDKKKILIIRTDRIGDVILTLPLSTLLKEKYPESKITFLCSNYTKEIPELCKSIDNIICIENFSFFELIENLISLDFNYAILVYPKFKISLSIFLSGIKHRIGTKFRWYSFFFNDKISHHRKESKKHELEYNSDLLSPFGIKNNIQIPSVQFNIQIDNITKQTLKIKFAETNFSKSKKTIIVHIGSGNSSVDWPKSYFKELVNLIARNLNVNLILTGNHQEKEMITKLFENVEIDYINFAGKLSIKEMFALCNIADLFISNSTGPIHIAATTNCKIIGFYPKIKNCSALRWGPYTHSKKIFEPELNCENCNTEQCQKLKCMETISVNEVYNYIDKEIN